MPGRDLHSRVVGWLKVALPLAALAILSTLFLLGDRIDPSAAIPYADVDVQDLARDPRIQAPTYAGTTEDGAGITLSAVEARAAAGDAPATAQGVSLRIDTPDGGRLDVAADAVTLDAAGRQALLAGGVRIVTASGYLVETAAVTVGLDRTGVRGDQLVSVTAPMGRITANSFVLTQDASDKAAYLLVFNGAVKLVYRPGG